MKLESLVLIRHSIRSDNLTPDHLLNLIEHLLDDEAELSRQNQLQQFLHIHTHNDLFQLLVKSLVQEKLLNDYMHIINDTNITKLNKIFNVLARASEEDAQFLARFIENIRIADQKIISQRLAYTNLSAIDPPIVYFDNLAYKQCYLLAKYLFKIFVLKHCVGNTCNKPLKFYIHSSPYKRCLESAVYIIQHLQQFLQSSDNRNITFIIKIDNFLSDYYYKNYFDDENKYLQSNPLISDIILNSHIDDKVQKTLIETNEKWLFDKINNSVNVKYEFTWDKNLLGKQGPLNHGTLNGFTNRCLKGACNLVDYYDNNTDTKQTTNTALVITHGGLINNYLNNYTNATNNPLNVNRHIEYKFIEIRPSSFIFLQKLPENDANNKKWLLEYSNVNFPCFKKSIANDDSTFSYDKVIDFDTFRELPQNYINQDVLDSNEQIDDDYILIKKNNSSFTLVNKLSSNEENSNRSRKNTILTTNDRLFDFDSLKQHYNSPIQAEDVALDHHHHHHHHQQEQQQQQQQDQTNDEETGGFYNFNQNSFTMNPNLFDKTQSRIVFEKAVSLETSFNNNVNDNSDDGNFYFPVRTNNYSQDDVISSSKDKRNNNISNKNTELNAKLSSFKLNWDLPSKNLLGASKSFQGPMSGDTGTGSSELSNPTDKRRRAKSAAFYFADDDESSSDEDSEDSDSLNENEESVSVSVAAPTPALAPAPTRGEASISPRTKIADPLLPEIPQINEEGIIYEKAPKVVINEQQKQSPTLQQSAVESMTQGFKRLSENSTVNNSDNNNNHYNNNKSISSSQVIGEVSDDNMAVDYLGLDKNYSEDEDDEIAGFDDLYSKPKSTSNIPASMSSLGDGVDKSLKKRIRFETISLPIKDADRNKSGVDIDEHELNDQEQGQQEQEADDNVSDNLNNGVNSNNSSYSSFEIRTPNIGSPLTDHDTPIYHHVKPINDKDISSCSLSSSSSSSAIIADPVEKSPQKQKAHSRGKIILIKNTNSYKSLSIENGEINFEKQQQQQQQQQRQVKINVKNSNENSGKLRPYFSSPVYDNFFESLNSIGQNRITSNTITANTGSNVAQVGSIKPKYISALASSSSSSPKSQPLYLHRKRLRSRSTIHQNGTNNASTNGDSYGNNNTNDDGKENKIIFVSNSSETTHHNIF